VLTGKKSQPANTGKIVFLTFQKNAAVCPNCGYTSCSPGQDCPKCGTRMVSKGGPGSGYSNHPGRPGQRGGSRADGKPNVDGSPEGGSSGDSGGRAPEARGRAGSNSVVTGEKFDPSNSETYPSPPGPISRIDQDVVGKRGGSSEFSPNTEIYIIRITEDLDNGVDPSGSYENLSLMMSSDMDVNFGNMNIGVKDVSYDKNNSYCWMTEKGDISARIRYINKEGKVWEAFACNKGRSVADISKRTTSVAATGPLPFKSNQMSDKLGDYVDNIAYSLYSPESEYRKKGYSEPNRKVLKTDKANQIVYGEVYSPYHIDTDREAMRPEDIRKAAWGFLANGKVDNIDIQHSLQKSGCQVVESFIAREGDPDFIAGSWVLAVKCPDDVWDKVLKGELNGFSFYGTVEKYPATVLVQVTKQMAGVTEKSTHPMVPEHEHTFIVNMDNLGAIVSGRTDSVQGHWHPITKGTATDLSLDHVHRIVLE